MFKSHSEDGIKEKTKNKALELLATLESNDRVAFKALFDDGILNMQDYQVGEDYSFMVFNGKLISISQRTFHTGDRISNIKDSYEKAAATYDVVTTDNEYVIYIEYFTAHDNDEYVGKVRKFKILEKKEVAQTGAFAEMGWRYGVYYPGWIDE